MSTRSYWKAGKLGFWDNQINTTYQTGVWANAPLLPMAIDPTVAYDFFEDWMNWKGVAVATTAMAGWTVTQATAGGVTTSDTLQGGICVIDCDSATEGQGMNIQYTEGTLPFIPVAGRDIWFEAKIKVTDAVDDVQLFVGLSAADTSIISGNDMTAANHIGFECLSSAALLFGAEKAGTEATPVAATTLVEATYVRVGFHVNGVTDVTHYVDGVKIGTSILTANIPVVGITPSFVCQSGSSTGEPELYVDWVRCVQVRA